MKTWVKVLLGIAGVIALSVAAVFYFTSGITRVGDDFFAAVGDGNMDQAYAVLSDDFRAGTSQAEVTAYLAENGMDKVTDTSWSSRAIHSGRGSLTGTVTTAEGSDIPVEIDLVKEEDQWKIYAIRNTEGTAGFSNVAKGLPDENQQVALVTATMGIFVDAVAAKDMAGLHDHISRIWANQIDVAGLEKIYESLFAVGDDAQIIKSMAPVFDSPAMLSDEGIMEIKGHYRTKPSRFHFDVKYIYEGTGWKLAGLSVQIK